MATAKKKVTLNSDKAIEDKKPVKGKRKEYATSTDLLRLRVQPTGTKTFVWYYRDADGKNKMEVLGNFPDINLDEATKLLLEAKKAQAVAPTGKGSPLTVADLTAKFYALAIKPHRDHPLAAKQILDADIDKHIGAIRLRDLTVDDLRLPSIEATKRGAMGQARRIMALTKQMCGFAYRSDYIAHAYHLKLDAKDAGVTKGKSKNRVLTDDEILAILAEVDTTTKMSQSFKYAIKILLVTGLRTGELRRNTWDNVDFTAKTITIPVSIQKSRNKVENPTPFIVPLTPLAVRWLRDLHQFTGDSPYIMAGLKGGVADEKSLAHAIRRIRAKMNKDAEEQGIEPIPDWSPHDLRRSMRTGLSTLKVEPAIAELCIGHSLGKIFSTYDLADTLPQRREAMTKWDAHLNGLLNVMPALKVVSNG